MTRRAWGKDVVTSYTIRILMIVFVLCIWQWAGSMSDRNHFFYSTPREVFVRLVNDFISGGLLSDTIATCEEVALGALSGFLCGYIGGLILWWFRPLGKALEPLIVALASIPVFAVAPLLVFWFGVGLTGKVAVVALSVVFMCLLATYQSSVQIENEYQELSVCFHTSRKQIFSMLIAKGALYLSSGTYRLAMVFGFIGAFIAELISSSKGLGHYIQRSSGLYDVAGILAGLLVFVVCSLLLVFTLEAIDRRWSVWR